MSSNKIILKTTALFASLRVASILVTIATGKLIAYMLGVTGIGLFGILNSVLSLISSVADLGVSKSSIRNISEANGEGDSKKIVYTISLVSKIIFFTGAAGAILTILLSYFISILTFGNASYWFSFVLIGVSVFFTVIKNGQTAIFQGLRKFSFISRNTIISSVLGFLILVPLIYFLKEGGIVYTILSTAVIGFIVSKYFVNQLEYSIEEKKVKLTLSNSKEIIRLGLAMMWVSFLVALSGYLIRSYISINGDLHQVGFFQAGFQIISGYFGIIFTSMSADYFPRISAINKENKKLEKEVNQQSVIMLLLISPLVVILSYTMPFIVSLLYTAQFTSTIDYVNFALFGVIFQAGSQTMDMVLLAKNNAKVFTVSVFIFRVFFLLTNILGYYYYGISGLGISFSVNMLFHLLGMQILNYKLYKISFNKEFVYTLIIVLFFSAVAFYTRNLTGSFKYIIASILTTLSVGFTLYRFKRLLDIDSYLMFIKKIMSKIKKPQ